MKTPPKIGAAGIALVAVALILFCLRLWQPEHQARLHTLHFLKAVEDRDYSRMSAQIDDAYADRWGFKKATLISNSREVLRQFFSVVVEEAITSVERGDEAIVVSVRIKLGGTGTGISEVAKDRVNGLTEPFAMRWARRSWKPWDWKLSRVDQPQLRVAPQDFDSIF